MKLSSIIFLIGIMVVSGCDYKDDGTSQYVMNEDDYDDDCMADCLGMYEGGVRLLSRPKWVCKRRCAVKYIEIPAPLEEDDVVDPKEL